MTCRALLIGCDEFADPELAALTSPRLDVRLMREALSSPRWGLFRDEHIRTLTNPTSADARTEISDFLLSAQRQDTMLIYYTGHGNPLGHDRDRLFLATTDTDLRRLAATSVHTEYINSVVAEMSAKTAEVVLLLDACSAGSHEVDLRLSSQLYVVGAKPAGATAQDGTTEEASPFATAVARTLLGLQTDGRGPITTDDLFNSLVSAGTYPFRSATARGMIRLTGSRDGATPREDDFRRALLLARSPETREAGRQIERLPAGPREACRDLLVVPEDSPVSERWITAWWSAEEGRRLSDPEALLQELIDRRLVEVRVNARDGHGRLVGLNVAARKNLSTEFVAERRRSAYESMIRTARRRLLPLGEPDAWWLLPAEPEALWGRMPRHLENAGRVAEADQLRCDPRWIELRIRRTGSVSESLATLAAIAARMPQAGDLRAELLRHRHLIDPVAHADALRPVLLSRIPGVRDVLESGCTGPRLEAAWPLPDDSHPAQRMLWRVGDQGAPLAVMPSAELVAATGEAEIQLFDPATGDHHGPRRFEDDDSSNAPLCCAVVNSGRSLVVGGERGLRILPLGAGEIARADVGRVLACATDGNTLLFAGEDNIARVVAVSAEGTFGKKDELLGHRDVVNCCAMAGGMLATGSDDRTVRLWELTGKDKENTQPLDAVDGGVLCCWILPAARRVLGGTAEGAVMEWTTGGSSPRLLHRHAGAVRCVVADPAERWVASSGDDGTVQVSARHSGLAGDYGPAEVLHGHRGAVTSLVASADGRWLASSGEDGTVRIWDPAVRAEDRRPDRTEPVRFCVPSATGDWFLCGGSTTSALHRWHRDRPGAPETIGRGAVTAAAIGADDDLVLAGSADGSLRLYEGGRLTRTFQQAPGAVTACLLSADRKWAVAGHLTGEVRIHPLTGDNGPVRYTVDRTAIRALAEAPGGQLAAFSRRGSRLLVALAGATAEKARHTAHDPLLAVHGTPAGVFVATRPDGHVASGSLNAIGLDSPIDLKLPVGTPTVKFLTAAPDRHGERLVTADSGRSIRVWTPHGDQLAEFPLDQPVADCRWLDEETVVAAGDAGVHLLTFHES